MSEVKGLTFSVSYTTRAPRGKEVNGESYFFTTREAFEELIANDELLEFAKVFGNYYGTGRSALEDAAKKECDLVLDIDVQGAGQLKRKLPGAVSIFVLPPSRETLEARLRSRSEDPDNVIDRRLTDAAREIGNYESYDYVLINDNLDESSKTLAGIVRAERARRARVEEKIQPILETFREAVTKE